MRQKGLCPHNRNPSEISMSVAGFEPYLSRPCVAIAKSNYETAMVPELTFTVTTDNEDMT
jgi:hypothetical protein